jgi:4-amino-4-deoxy-L-arabinose transferase-like glycosyltransferase
MGNQATVASQFWGFVERASKVPVGVAVALAVVLRVGAGLAISAGTTRYYEYGAIARHIVAGKGYSYFPALGDAVLPLTQMDEASRWLPSAYVPPVYTYVTVAATELGGGSHAGTVWALRGFNLLMACATVRAIHALARRLTGSPAAANLAALGAAVHPPFVYVATQVSGANLYVLVEVLLVLALLTAAYRKDWRAWVAAGALLGLLSVLRGEAVVLIPLAAVWLLWAARRAGIDGYRRLTVLFVAVACLLPVGWMARNWSAFGRPVLAVATTGGYNLWAGNHPGATGSQKGAVYSPELRERLLELPPDADFELEHDYVLRQAAVDYIREEPDQALVGVARKAALLVVADVYDARSRNPLYIGGWLVLLAWGALGLVGWWRSEQADRAMRVLIAGLLTFSAVIPLVFVVLPRYRLPIESMLLVFAGGWLATGATRASAKATAVSADPPVVTPG